MADEIDTLVEGILDGIDADVHARIRQAYEKGFAAGKAKAKEENTITPLQSKALYQICDILWPVGTFNREFPSIVTPYGVDRIVSTVRTKVSERDGLRRDLTVRTTSHEATLKELAQVKEQLAAAQKPVGQGSYSIGYLDGFEQAKHQAITAVKSIERC